LPADHAELALKARSEGKRTRIVSGGELTVTVRGNGRGGPNQEYALALADLLKDTPGIARWRRYRRRRRRRRQRGRSGRRGHRPATFTKMKSLGLDPRPISPTTTPPRSFRPPAISC
jgi:hydroxypyruvate reductase